MASSYTPDPHAVSTEEAFSYYAGLPSEPVLLYRTGKRWHPPRGPEAQRRLKELREVFTHPIVNVWNDDLGWKVVEVMDAHAIRFTTIDIVQFKKVDDYEPPDYECEEERNAKKPIISPVTIWIGVSPESTSATAAHDAAQVVLAILKEYQITDVDIDFRESLYMREVGPRLRAPVDDDDPLHEVVRPLTPALGLGISLKARPDAQGTMALYLAEGGGSRRLLGLSCRHVLISSEEANMDYIRHQNSHPIDVLIPSEEANVDYVRHRNRLPRDVILLGRGAYTSLVDSIKGKTRSHGFDIKYWKEQIEVLEKREKGTDAADVEKAKKRHITVQKLVDNAENAMEPLAVFLDQVHKDWRKPDNRVLGHILYSPAIALGVGGHRFTEDWGIFLVNRDKLGEGFQGNKMDLGTNIDPVKFMAKCSPRGEDNWEFEYPYDCLLPLEGILTDELMRHPDMWNSDGEPCLLVIKNGNTTGTTIGRANGLFSIVRDYFNDMSINQTSMEWGIIKYDSGSEDFSGPGDSGSIIADIRGRIGGMLTGSSGQSASSDITYATPFWWLLERIKASGFPHVHLDVVG